MEEPVPTGRDRSAGTYKCTNSGETINVAGRLDAACPSCHGTSWGTPLDGDSVDDPYPDRS